VSRRAAAVATALVLLAIGLLAVRQVGNPDTGFHLRAGAHILSGAGFPRTDPFTFTVADRPYVDTSWGFQVLLALAERAAGPVGIVLFGVVLVLATFLLLRATARLGPCDELTVAGLLLLGACAAEPRFEPRPELLSWALLALVLHLLHRHAEGRGAPLWLLPPIFAVWANAHALFAAGLAALACFALAALARGRLDRALAGWSAAAAAATLLNPYGVRALLFPFTLLTRMDRGNVFARRIGEFESLFGQLRSEQLGFYLVPLACAVCWLLLAVASAPRLWRQRRGRCLLLGAVFLLPALAMVRNVPLLVVATLPGLAWGLAPAPVTAARRPRVWAAAGLAGLALLLSVRTVTDAYYVGARRFERFGVDWNRIALPVDALDWAAGAGLPGRPLNHLNFGGYLMWRSGRPVFVDGRLEVIGERFYAEYRLALDAPAAREQAVARHGLGWIVFPHRVEPGLFAALSGDGRWRLGYVDAVAAIFVRADAGWEHEIAPGAWELLAGDAPAPELERLPGPRDRRPVAAWLAGLYRRQVYPVAPYHRGLLHAARGEPGPALAWFAAAIRDSGGRYAELDARLGSALAALGRTEEARAAYHRALAGAAPWRFAHRRMLRQRLAQLDASLSPAR